MNTTQHIHVHETTTHNHAMHTTTTTTTPHVHIQNTTLTTHMHIHDTTSTPHVHIHDTTPTTHIHNHDTTTMDHSNHGNSNNSGGHDMMSMFFHGGYKEIVLFDFWRTSNVGIFIMSCFILFAISVLYEGLKLLRHKILQKEFQNKIRSTQNSTSSNGQTKFEIQEKASRKYNFITTGSIIQALLHMLQAIISYSLMMVFMTFNVWLCLSLVLGTGVGYILFGHRRYATDFDEHCN